MDRPSFFPADDLTAEMFRPAAIAEPEAVEEPEAVLELIAAGELVAEPEAPAVLEAEPVQVLEQSEGIEQGSFQEQDLVQDEGCAQMIAAQTDPVLSDQNITAADTDLPHDPLAPIRAMSAAERIALFS